jgi:hypothetical protein
MSSGAPNPSDVKMLPGATASPPANDARIVTPASGPLKQLSELPRDELENLAEEYGLDPTQFKTRQLLVVAIHDRRQLIASMDRDAMMDVIKWGRRPVTANASKEDLAQEIARIRTMRFSGLTQRGLVTLARLRGVPVAGDEPVPILVRKLKRQEGFFSKLNRKRRALLGSIVSGMIGESVGGDYQYLPPASSSGAASSSASRPSSIKEEIEESGLIGGLAGRIKRSADGYVNQKLDEIEARIDRKLDEIDRRLAEWRDKEIANRIRIIKITLWVSVIVAVVSLIYSYVKLYLWPR